MKKIVFIFLLLVPVVFSYPQQYRQYQKVLPELYDNAALSDFGHSVAVSGDFAVVGEDGFNGMRGRVVLYEYRKEEWVRVAELVSSDADPRDIFGYSVSMYGDTVVVGAPGDDEGGDRCGAVYFFGKPVGGWKDMSETFKLLPKDGGKNKSFGYSLSFSGKMLVVGSPDSDNRKGTVYLYLKEKEWTGKEDVMILSASDGVAGDRLGTSVSGVGDLVVAGAPGKDSRGLVYLFERPLAGWTDMEETARLSATDLQQNDGLGTSVGVWGETVVAGMNNVRTTVRGKVFVFERPAGGWQDMTQTALLQPTDAMDNDHFGVSVAIAGDTIVAGAPMMSAGVEYSGAVYLFIRPSGGWTDVKQVARLQAAEARSFSHLGTSVSICPGKVLAGAPHSDDLGKNSGAVYLFQNKKNKWVDATEDEKFLPKSYPTDQGENFGTVADISGDYAVVGAWGYDNDRGRVFVYHNERGVWKRVAELTASDGKANDTFGWSVAIDGNTVVAGAPSCNNYMGALYVFVMPGGGWTDMTETAVLSPLAGAQGAGFGRVVAIDGEVIVAGLPYQNAGSNLYYRGSVYVFEKPQTGWEDMSPTALLEPSDGIGWQHFGQAVAICDSVIMVGSPDDDDLGRQSGSVYFFREPPEGWKDMTETAKILAGDGAEYDHFGEHLALDSTILVVTADGDDDNGLNSGSVYLFERADGGWPATTGSVKLLPSDGVPSRAFGSSVATDDGKVLVGCSQDRTNGTGSGAVYLFRKPAGSWRDTTESEKYIAEDGTSFEEFGESVAMDGRYFLAGAGYDDDHGYRSGSAYFFREYDPVEITEQPHDSSDLCAGASLQLKAEAKFVTSYQWQISRDEGRTFTDLADGGVFSGVHGNTLQIVFDASLDSSLYRCVLVNPIDTAVTDTVCLTLDTLPPLLEVQDVTVQLDDNGRAVITPADVVTAAGDNCGVADTLIDRDTLTTADIGMVQVTVTLRDEQDNITEKAVTVTVEEYTGIGASRMSGVRIYPNPAGDYLNVVAEGSIIRSLTVTDMAGRKVLVKRGPLTTGRLGISDLNEGVYFLRVQTDQSTAIYRFVKK